MVLTTAACTVPWSSAWYWAPISSGLNVAGVDPVGALDLRAGRRGPAGTAAVPRASARPATLRQVSDRLQLVLDRVVERDGDRVGVAERRRVEQLEPVRQRIALAGLVCL